MIICIKHKNLLFLLRRNLREHTQEHKAYEVNGFYVKHTKTKILFIRNIEPRILLGKKSHCGSAPRSTKLIK